MGSGETTTGMLGVHREVFAGLPDPTDARLMDSPFAFQENADELVEKINQYFTESLGHPLRAITLPASADALTVERALADIRAADWVFAGPGSPSYARRCWEATGVPEALAGVVAPGRSGALVFASAAVVTLGDWALPVYEIYKVGEDPRWEPGIGLMSQILGWRCAVIPHYDNREGGTHDTRFCYVGGRRLAQIESDLGDGFILGVDEHTALVLDLDAGTAWVAGRSAVTLRVAGVEDVVPNGSRLTIAELEDRIAALGAGEAVGRAGEGLGAARGVGAGATGSVGPSEQQGVNGPRGVQPADLDPRAEVAPAAARPAAPPAATPTEDLARTILAALPAAATDERAAVVALVHQAEAASATHDRELAGRAVQALVDLRADSRAAGDWSASDRLRDVLAGVGVEVRDSREGSTWQWM
jgi:cyanophycinase-like exopeptidase